MEQIVTEIDRKIERAVDEIMKGIGFNNNPFNSFADIRKFARSCVIKGVLISEK